MSNVVPGDSLHPMLKHVVIYISRKYSFYMPGPLACGASKFDSLVECRAYFRGAKGVGCFCPLT